MIILKESWGDVQLCKFIIVITPKIEGVLESYYSDKIQAYFFSWEFVYNTLSKEVDDNYDYHDNLYESLPDEIQEQVRSDRSSDLIYGHVTYGYGDDDKLTKLLHFYIHPKDVGPQQDAIEFAKTRMKRYNYTDVIFSDEVAGVIER